MSKETKSTEKPSKEKGEVKSEEILDPTPLTCEDFLKTFELPDVGQKFVRKKYSESVVPKSEWIKVLQKDKLIAL